MKILKPELSSPPNVVHFEVSLEMTKHDVKNYLEKIYKLDVIDVDTRIALGRIHKAKNGNYLIKDEDQKLAFVTLVTKILMFINYFIINGEILEYNIFLRVILAKGSEI